MELNCNIKELKKLILHCEATKDEGLCSWCPLHFACATGEDGIIQFIPHDDISKPVNTGVVYRCSPDEI